MNTSRAYAETSVPESPITQRLKSEKGSQRKGIKEFRESNEIVDPEVWFPVRIAWLEDVAIAIQMELTSTESANDDPYILAIQRVAMAAVNAGVDEYRAKFAQTGDNKSACVKGLRAAAKTWWIAQDGQALGILNSTASPLEDEELWIKLAANVDNTLSNYLPKYNELDLSERAGVLYGAIAEQHLSITALRKAVEESADVEAPTTQPDNAVEIQDERYDPARELENWQDRQSEIELHRLLTERLAALPLTGNLAALRDVVIRQPDLVDANCRLNCKAVATRLRSTPRQISVEWDRLKKRARSAA